MPHPQLTVIEAALNQHRGDDLARAKRCFQGLTEAQMNEPWGTSGRTRASALEQFERHEKSIDDALAWARRKASEEA